jgi:hypothetical protein
MFLLGIIWRYFILETTPFDGLYGQDPYAYLNFSRSLSLFISGIELPPFFWPWGYPIVLAISESLGANPVTINILFGTLIPGLIFILGKQLDLSFWGALTAALVTLTSGQLTLSSLVLMSDIAALFWILLSCIFLLKYLKTKHIVAGIGSSSAIALAGVTRWLSLIVIIPWGILAWRQCRDLIKISLMAIPVVVLCGIQIWLSQNDQFPSFGHHFLGNWRISNFWSSSLSGLEGVTIHRFPNFIFYTKAFSDSFFISPIFGILALFGVHHLVKSSKKDVLILLAFWWLSTYLFLCGLPVQNPRYCIPLIPVIALVIGFGFDFFSAKAKNIGAALALLILITLFLNTKTNHGQIVRMLGVYNQDKEIAQEVYDSIGDGATLYAFGLTLTIQHYYPQIDTHELFFESPETMSNLRGGQNYLVMNPEIIDSQWKNTQIGETVGWLKANYQTKIVARYGSYSLFKIDGKQ